MRWAHSIIKVSINWFPIVPIHFEPLRGQSLYKGQTRLIYIGLKVSFVRRFNCTIRRIYKLTFGMQMMFLVSVSSVAWQEWMTLERPAVRVERPLLSVWVDLQCACDEEGQQLTC